MLTSFFRNYEPTLMGFTMSSFVSLIKKVMKLVLLLSAIGYIGTWGWLSVQCGELSGDFDTSVLRVTVKIRGYPPEDSVPSSDYVLPGDPEAGAVQYEFTITKTRGVVAFRMCFEHCCCRNTAPKVF